MLSMPCQVLERIYKPNKYKREVKIKVEVICLRVARHISSQFRINNVRSLVSSELVMSSISYRRMRAPDG